MTAKVEIERKFLVKKDLLPELLNGNDIMQSYIFIEENKELRVRISKQKCKMTIKITKSDLVREEYEYEIDIDEGIKLINSLDNKNLIEKTRYKILENNDEWVVDIFTGVNQGLILAEIELDNVNQSFAKPIWLDQEVTNDKRYYNSYLYNNPYSSWNETVTVETSNK